MTDHDERGPSKAGGQPIRVFASYAHESEHHKSDVLGLCELLRRNGIDADLDRWYTDSRQNWYDWMVRQVVESDYVIVVASQSYRRVSDGGVVRDDHPGVQSEVALLQDLLHGDRPKWTKKLLPVVLPGSTVDDIPLFLQPHVADHYIVTEFTKDGAAALIAALNGQPSAMRPPLGTVPFLPLRPPPAFATSRHGAARQDVTMTAEVLAQEVGHQWLRAEERSGVLTASMPVRWAVTTDAEAAMHGVSWQSVGVVSPHDLAGRFGDIADLVAGRLPHRRLVIIGDSGAGKTTLAIRLVRDLVRGRLPGQPIPVLLPIGAWNPMEQRLPDWISHRLAQDYPHLRAVTQGLDGRKESMASILVGGGRILPVLDGLDTIGVDLRAAAITAINSLGHEVPLVVTSLAEPYQKAVQAAERGLTHAAVVEILPLTPAETRDYLAPEGMPGRWRPLLAHLHDEPTSTVAQSLQTPLMLWLARKAYSDPSTDPAELSDRTRFPDRRATEDHLLDRFLPAAYPERPMPAVRRDTDEQWTQDDARSWLTFLARHLAASDTHDIAWWQLHSTMPRFRRLWNFLGPFLLGFPLGLAWNFAWGMVFGVVLGLIGSSQEALRILNATPTEVPYRLLISPRRLRGTLRRVLINAVLVLVPFAAGFILLYLPSHDLAITVAGGVLVLLGFALWAWTGLRRKRPDLSRELVVSTDPLSAATPDSTLRSDRDSTLVPAMAMLVIGGLGTALYQHAYGILSGLALALGWTMFGAWTRYSAARVTLALRDRLPWCTMAFLRDAEDRGVLRQVGAVYQFRHPRMRNRLADAKNATATDSISG